MVADLPQALQERIQQLLENNDFPRAKEIHDEWIAQQPQWAVA